VQISVKANLMRTLVGMTVIRIRFAIPPVNARSLAVVALVKTQMVMAKGITHKILIV
jgi:hypothetical protein